MSKKRVKELEDAMQRAIEKLEENDDTEGNSDLVDEAVIILRDTLAGRTPDIDR